MPGMEEGGGMEQRSVHVVYFLSRDGKAEQPHLIRVRRRRHPDGVRLRDVKRWLSELRGKAMPDAFAWSCKRRYKSGYVWEDLADDDLITPVSDDEYVLMGSLIINQVAGVGVTTATAVTGTSPILSSYSSSSAISSPASAGAEEYLSPVAGDPKSQLPPDMPPPENPDRDGDGDGDVSPEPPPCVDDEDEEEEDGGNEQRWEPLPPRSDAPTRTATRRAATALTLCPLPAGDAKGPPPPASAHVFRVTAKDAESGGEGEGKKSAATRPSSYCMLSSKSQSYQRCNDAGGIGCGRHLFRSLLRCGGGAAQTNDCAIVPVTPHRRGERSCVGDRRGDGGAGVHQPRYPTEEGRARKSQGGGRGRRRSRAGRAAGEQRKKTAPAAAGAYGPAPEPICSQCGRPFRPERLHSHMKSCGALKGKRKGQRKNKEAREATTRGSDSVGNATGGGSHFISPMPLAIRSI